MTRRQCIALMTVALTACATAPLLAAPASEAPRSVIDALCVTARKRFPPPAPDPKEPSSYLYGPSRYRIAPYDEGFVAITTSAVRGPWGYAAWRQRAGAWTWLFSYSESLPEEMMTPADLRAARAAEARRERALWAKAGLPEALQHTLVPHDTHGEAIAPTAVFPAVMKYIPRE